MEMIPRFIFDTSVISNILKRSNNSRQAGPKYPLLEKHVETILRNQELCVSIVTAFDYGGKSRLDCS
jgi:predicted nucleic acid-binding protein